MVSPFGNINEAVEPLLHSIWPLSRTALLQHKFKGENIEESVDMVDPSHSQTGSVMVSRYRGGPPYRSVKGSIKPNMINPEVLR